MKCGNCAKDLDAGTRFCGECGSEVMHIRRKPSKKLFRIFSILGLIGLADVATQSAVSNNSGLTDTGLVTIAIFGLLSSVLGVEIAGSITSILSPILQLSWIWLIVAYFFNQRAKMLVDPSLENLKNYKRTKVLVWILGGAFLLLMIILSIAF